MSQEAYRYLRGRFGAKSRGPRYYKGKGEMYTYFLAPGALPEEATPAPADAAEAIYYGSTLAHNELRYADAVARSRPSLVLTFVTFFCGLYTTLLLQLSSGSCF